MKMNNLSSRIVRLRANVLAVVLILGALGVIRTLMHGWGVVPFDDLMVALGKRFLGWSFVVLPLAALGASRDVQLWLHRRIPKPAPVPPAAPATPAVPATPPDPDAGFEYCCPGRWEGPMATWFIGNSVLVFFGTINAMLSAGLVGSGDRVDVLVTWLGYTAALCACGGLYDLVSHPLGQLVRPVQQTEVDKLAPPTLSTRDERYWRLPPFARKALGMFGCTLGLWMMMAVTRSITGPANGDWACYLIPRDTRAVDVALPPSKLDNIADATGWTLIRCSVHAKHGPKHEKVFRISDSNTALAELERLQGEADKRWSNPANTGWVDKITGKMLPWRFFIHVGENGRGQVVQVTDSTMAFGPNGELVSDLSLVTAKDRAVVKRAWMAQLRSGR